MCMYMCMSGSGWRSVGNPIQALLKSQTDVHCISCTGVSSSKFKTICIIASLISQSTSLSPTSERPVPWPLQHQTLSIALTPSPLSTSLKLSASRSKLGRASLVPGFPLSKPFISQLSTRRCPSGLGTMLAPTVGALDPEGLLRGKSGSLGGTLAYKVRSMRMGIRSARARARAR